MSEKLQEQTEAARFRFGANWARYLALVDDQRIATAEQSLRDMLELESLKGLLFLDVGSGGGLFSLAARNLGATVHSFDYDKESVGCTQALRERYWPEDDSWQVEQGDALDEDYLNGLGRFDVVYSWGGAAPHRGYVGGALQCGAFGGRGGQLFLAIYNDQRWLSRYWTRVKRIYNRGSIGRATVIASHAPYFLSRHIVKWLVRPSLSTKRGMDPWRDILDWLGGYPFEVARPETVLAFYRKRGFTLERMTTVDGRHGCNEFLFQAPAAGV